MLVQTEKYRQLSNGFSWDSVPGIHFPLRMNLNDFRSLLQTFPLSFQSIILFLLKCLNIYLTDWSEFSTQSHCPQRMNPTKFNHPLTLAPKNMVNMFWFSFKHLTTCGMDWHKWSAVIVSSYKNFGPHQINSPSILYLCLKTNDIAISLR